MYFRCLFSYVFDGRFYIVSICVLYLFSIWHNPVRFETARSRIRASQNAPGKNKSACVAFHAKSQFFIKSTSFIQKSGLMKMTVFNWHPYIFPDFRRFCLKSLHIIAFCFLLLKSVYRLHCVAFAWNCSLVDMLWFWLECSFSGHSWSVYIYI